MAAVSGQGTTFNLPNYHGRLINITPQDTPFITAMGGIQGGVIGIDTTLWTWQIESLRSADPNAQALEGANAPTAAAQDRSTAHNVLEIHHRAVETSYTKIATRGQFASTGSTHTGAVNVGADNPIPNEHAHQVELEIKSVARDLEKSFLVNTFSNPSSNSTARKTRGIMSATATNVSDQGTLVGDGASTIATDGTVTEASHGRSVGDIVISRSLGTGAIGVLAENQAYYVKTVGSSSTFTLSATSGGATITFASTGTADFYVATAMTKTMITDLMRQCYESGGLMETDTATVMTPPLLAPSLSKLFITNAGYAEQSRTVGGVAVKTIITEFGELNIMLNRHMPNSALQFVSLEECKIRGLVQPGKGIFFVEPLAKVGMAERDQLVGEFGLEYGDERKHAKLLGVKAAA